MPGAQVPAREVLLAVLPLLLPMLSPRVRMEMPLKLLALVTGGRRLRAEPSESVLLQGRGSSAFASPSLLLCLLLQARLRLSRGPLRGTGVRAQGCGSAWHAARLCHCTAAPWVLPTGPSFLGQALQRAQTLLSFPGLCWELALGLLLSQIPAWKMPAGSEPGALLKPSLSKALRQGWWRPCKVITFQMNCHGLAGKGPSRPSSSMGSSPQRASSSLWAALTCCLSGIHSGPSGGMEDDMERKEREEKRDLATWKANSGNSKAKRSKAPTVQGSQSKEERAQSQPSPSCDSHPYLWRSHRQKQG